MQPLTRFSKISAVLSLVLILAACSQLPPLLVDEAGLQAYEAQKAETSLPANPGPPGADVVVAEQTPEGETAPSGAGTGQATPARFDGVAGSPSIGDPKAPELGNTGYDVQQYTLHLVLDPFASQLDARAEIEARSALEGLSRLSLDFIGYDVSEVLVDGQPADFWREGAKLWLDMPEPQPAGQLFTLSIAYSGRPEPLTSRFVPFAPLGLNIDPEKGRAYTLNEPDGARSWFPANDHPLDKALFTFDITVPSPLVAVANGQLIEQQDLGDQIRYVYASDDPMATYLSVLAVGDYEIIEDQAPDGTPLRHYVFPEYREQAEAVFAVTPAAFAFLEGLFGPYPFDSYGHVMAEMGGVALETQTMTIWGDGFVDDPAEAFSQVVVHELAHQWIGDSVSPASWSETWLNESFATYAMMLWAERFEPDSAYDSLAAYEANPSQDVVLNDPAPDALFGRDPYVKGAWVLHMLRHELGDEAFFAMLPRYASRYADSTVDAADLQLVAEVVADRELADFFEQWVYRPGLPQFNFGWTARTAEEDGQTTVLLRVCQHQPEAVENPFEFPLEIELADSIQQTRETLPVSEAEQGFALPLPFEPTQITADPDNSLLADIFTEAINALTPCEAP